MFHTGSLRMLQSHSQKIQGASQQFDTALRLPADTFLLDPNNGNRNLGQSQLWKLFKKELFLLILLLCLSIFLLSLTVQGAHAITTASQVQDSGIFIQGEVVGRRVTPMGGRGQAMAYSLKY